MADVPAVGAITRKSSRRVDHLSVEQWSDEAEAYVTVRPTSADHLAAIRVKQSLLARIGSSRPSCPLRKYTLPTVDEATARLFSYRESYETSRRGDGRTCRTAPHHRPRAR